MPVVLLKYFSSIEEACQELKASACALLFLSSEDVLCGDLISLIIATLKSITQAFRVAKVC